MRQKHIPQRTCIVCKTKVDKRDLIRLVRVPDGVEVDGTGRKNGRGAYLCHNERCWQCAMNSNVLDRALNITLNHEDKRCLQQALGHS